jgi:chromosome segregation ATPase
MQTDQLTILQGRIRDIQRDLSEAESQVLPVKFELTRCQREKESVESRAKWLEGELQTKTQELYRLRVEDGSNMQSIEAELAQAKNESGSRLERIGQLEVSVCDCCCVS